MAEQFGTGRWSAGRAVRAGLAAALTVSLAGCAAGGGSGWAGVAAVAVVVAGLAGCRSGTPESGEAAARGTATVETAPARADAATTEGTDVAQASGSGVASEPSPAREPSQAGEPDTAEPGDAVAGDARAPGIDPAWDAGSDAGASGSVPASLGTRPAASQSEDEAWSPPRGWQSRRAPPWKGERLEGRVRPRPAPAGQVKP